MGTIKGRSSHRALLEQLTTQKFTEELRKQEADRQAALKKDAEMATQLAKDRRTRLLQEEKRKEGDKKMAEEELIAYHRQTLERKRAQERQDLRVELALLYKAEQRKWAAKEASRCDAAVGIEGFETNLRRLGLDAGAEADADPIIPTQGTTAHDTLRTILGKLPPSGAIEQSGREYLERIKRRKAEETQARKERERRRRKVVVEQALALAAVQETRQAEAAAGALARASRAEERMRAHLEALRAEKETIVANRVQREKELAEQREREWQAALERDRQLGAENRAAYVQRAVEEAKRHEEEKRKRKEEKRKQVEAACRDILNQMVGLAEMTIDYRETADSNGLLPRSTWRDWKALFASGAQLYVPTEKSNVDAVGGADEEADPRDEESLKDYVTSRGVWASSTTATESASARALEGVWQAASVAVAVPIVPVAGKLNVALKLAVTGTPFAGKTSVAQALAARYNLALINPETLVAKAVEAAEQSHRQARPSEEVGGDVTEAPLVTLGREVQAELSSSGQVSDDVTLRLILHAITNLPKPQTPVNPSPSSGRAESRKGAKGARAKAPSPAPPPDSANGALLPLDMPRGFVIDGYPHTEGEARRLERALTGLDLEAEAKRKAERPRLLPDEEAPQEPVVLTSGLDKIFVCSLSDDAAALKRALGRRVDPTTGKMYHLEYSPPAEEDNIIHSRLLDPSPDRAANGASLLQSAPATWQPLNGWLARFGSTAVELDAAGPMTSAPSAAVGIAEEVLKIKAKARAAEGSAKAAAKAAEQVASCTASAEAATRAASDAAAALYRAARAQQEASTGLQPEETRLVVQAAAADLQALLKQAANAKEEAEAAKQAAIVAAKSALEAADSACSSAADVGTSTTAAADAARAQVDAENARARAQASQERAEKAAAEAEKLWRKAERKAAGEPEPAEEAAAETDKGSVPTPSPLPPTALPLSGPDSTALLETWRNLEAGYCASAGAALKKCREEREAAVADCRAVKTDFLEFLNRQDGKQRIADEFQEEFNEVDARLRHNGSMKEELGEKVQELRDALWGECDARKEESARERTARVQEGRVGRHVAQTAKAHAELAQNEFSRLASTLSFLETYHARRFALQTPNLLPAPSVAPDTAALPADPSWVATAPSEIAAIARRTLRLLQSSRLALIEIVNPPEVTAAPSRQRSENSAKGKRASDIGKPKKGDKKGDKGPANERPKSPETTHVVAENPEVAARRECARGLLQAVEEEGLRGLDRLRQLAETAADEMGAVKEMEARAFARLEEWIATRFKTECVAVTSLVDMASAAVDEGIALWYKLIIQGEKFEVDEATLMMECPPPPAPPEPCPPSGIMPVDALDALAAAFADTAPSGRVPLEAAAEALVRVARACVEARSNPANQPVAPRLPGRQKRGSTEEEKFEVLWADVSEETVQACCAAFNAGPAANGPLSWRRFLSSLIAENSAGAIDAGEPEDVAHARAALELADKDADGKLSYEEWMGAQLWFQGDDSPDTFKRGAALKAVLFRMCADAEESLVTWQTLLQYLCVRQQSATWQLETSAAAAGAAPPDYAVTAEQLHQLLSWDGPVGSASLGLPALKTLVQGHSGVNSSGENDPPQVPTSEIATNPAFEAVHAALQRLYTWTPCAPLVVEHRLRDLDLARAGREARASSGFSESSGASKKGGPGAAQKGKGQAVRGQSPTPAKSSAAAKTGAKPAKR